MNTIYEQVNAQAALDVQLATNIQPDHHLDCSSIEVDQLNIDDSIDTKATCQNDETHTHVDKRSMKSRFHCLPLVLLKTKKDNGVAVSSTSVDITHEPMSSLRFSSEAMEAMKSDKKGNGYIHQKEINTTKEKAMNEVDFSSWPVAVEGLNDRLERLERAIIQLAENGAQPRIPPRDDRDRVIQLYDRIPNKITIQYFLNTGKKILPRIKLELRHKVRDSNGKPYYPAYQTLYGNCYSDYGRTKLDKFTKYSINYEHIDQISPLRDFVSRAIRELDGENDYLGTFFYEPDTTEIFPHAYVLFNKNDQYGKLFLFNGENFIGEEFEFTKSKAKEGVKSPDGIYTINQDRISDMLGL